jgi:hypothetical protein
MRGLYPLRGVQKNWRASHNAIYDALPRCSTNWCVNTAL